MAYKLYNEQNVQDIANAIRDKTASTDTLKISEMASAIQSITVEDPPTSASEFIFDGEKVTKYVGNRTEITIPRSYSKETVIETIDGAWCEPRCLEDFRQVLWEPFNITFKYEDKTMSFNSEESLWDISSEFPEGAYLATCVVEDPMQFEFINWFGKQYWSDTGIYINGTHFTDFREAFMYIMDTEITEVNFGGDIEVTHFKDGNDYQVTWIYGDMNLNKTVQKINILDNITKLGGETYETGVNCFKNIDFINMPNSITLLGHVAISGATATQLVLPKSITKIGRNAGGANNDELYSVYYLGTPDEWAVIERDMEGTGYPIDNVIDEVQSVKMLDSSDRLYLISNIKFDDSTTSISEYCFAGCIPLESLDTGNGLVNISREAFAYCKNLRSVKIGDSVTTIDVGAFAECRNLEELIIGDNVTDINNGAFEYCSNLNQIVFPASIRKIGLNAFTGSTTRTKYDFIYLDAVPTLEAVGTRIFSGAEDYQIVVNQELLEQFKTAENWNDVADHIVGFVVNDLTLTAQETNSSVGYDASPRFGFVDTSRIKYSLNGGEWISWTDGTAINLPNVGDYIKIRNGNTSLSKMWSTTSCFKFVMTGKISASGDCRSLIRYASLSEYCFANLFRNCTSLVSTADNFLPEQDLAPYCYYGMFAGCTNLQNNIKLPAIHLKASCYEEMFLSSSLKVATTQSEEYPYEYRIPYGTEQGTDANRATNRMFDGMGTGSAIAINTIYYTNKIVGAVTTTDLTFTAEQENSTIGYIIQGTVDTSGISYKLNDGEWTNWTNGAAITLANVGDKIKIKNSNNTLSTGSINYFNFTMSGKIAGSGDIYSMINYAPLSTYCFTKMFLRCTSLTTAPNLSATTLAQSCYNSMFRGCSGLTTLPSLPATTLEKYCYQQMFDGCSKIKLSTTQSAEYPNEYRIPYGEEEGILAYSAVNNMFTSTGGTFTGDPEINTTYYTSNEVV